MSWLEWNDEAFEEARERRCAVLLFVKASWCRWCKDLEQRVFQEERVRARLEESFVSVRVDKDRRPDVAATYTRRGWPTLAFLDDQGEQVHAVNFLETEPLLALLDRISVAAAAGELDALRDELASEAAALPEPSPSVPTRRRSPVALGVPAAELSMEIVEHVAKTVLATADPLHGGWGRTQKFPHPEAIDFALIRWSQTGDAQMLGLVRHTLRKMQSGEIHDSLDGGFYRYATQADWSQPLYEKLLDSNAQRTFAYLEAFQAIGDESFERTARHTLEWMVRVLLDPETHAFRGSQDADPEYARLSSRAQRAAHGAPPCDPTHFADWNAMAISTLLKADAVLGEHEWRERAVDALEFLLRELWDPCAGVHHYWDGERHLPGLLGDQAYTLRALVDAVQFLGEGRYLERALELADLTIENLRAEGGGFYDRPAQRGALGGMRRRDRSILENSVMAEALLRLSTLSGLRSYEQHAREALAAFAGDYKRFGHYVAGYARAVDLLHHVPVVVTIIGERGSAPVEELQRAALRPYVASRVVRCLDPRTDASRLGRFGLVAPLVGARAYVERGRESYAETDDPLKLPGLMTRT
jgi:uncharacterized protein YyaL (SSP411 family)